MSAVRRYFVKQWHLSEKINDLPCNCEPDKCAEVVEAAAYEALQRDLATVQGERERLRGALEGIHTAWNTMHHSPEANWGFHSWYSANIDLIAAALAQPAAPSAPVACSVDHPETDFGIRGEVKK